MEDFFHFFFLLIFYLNALYITGDTCDPSPSNISTIYGVVGTIRLLAGICLVHYFLSPIFYVPFFLLS